MLGLVNFEDALTFVNAGSHLSALAADQSDKRERDRNKAKEREAEPACCGVCQPALKQEKRRERKVRNPRDAHGPQFGHQTQQDAENPRKDDAIAGDADRLQLARCGVQPDVEDLDEDQGDQQERGFGERHKGVLAARVGEGQCNLCPVAAGADQSVQPLWRRHMVTLCPSGTASQGSSA